MANLSTLASGSSVVLTVTDQQNIVLNNGRSDVARLTITTGPGAGTVVTASHNGRRVYGPFGAGTVTLAAVSGECRYELSGDTVSPLDDDTQPLTPSENQTVRALVSGAGIAPPPAPPAAGVPVVMAPVAAAGTAVRATLTDVTRVAPNGQLLRGVRITATGVTTWGGADFVIAIPSTYALGRHTALFYAEPEATGHSIDLTVQLGDSSAFSGNVFYSTTPTQKISQPGWFTRAPGKDADAARPWTVAGGSPVFGTTTFTHLRVRMNITTGQTPWVEFYGMEYAADVDVPAFVLTVDDGYADNYTIGAPAFERYGMRGSFAIIADLIGTAGYMTWEQLRDLRDRGHECVVHGCKDGVANLSLLSGYDAILADVSYHRQALIDNGLNVRGSANCYVYPQGIFERSARDTDIRRALEAAGFVAGRAANQTIAEQARCRFGVDPWQINVFGHAWTNEPAEAANISALQGRITAGATDKRDNVLMLHKFVTGTAAAAIEIQESNLNLLLSTAAASIGAGSMKNMLLSELAYAMAGKQRPLI